MHKLERSLNLFNVVAISVGAMLGGEIFVLPAVAAQMTGPSLWLAYLVAAILVLPAAVSQCELATAMPESGGAYLYIERAMGPLAGTVAGIGLWLSLLLKSTFALVVLGHYLAIIVDVPTTGIELALIVGVVTLNLAGVRKVGRVQTIVVACCFFALAALAGLGTSLAAERTATATPWLRDGTSGFLAAVGLVFISYAGVTKIAAVAEEVRRPERNVPRGIFISLFAVAALYTAVAAVLASSFPIGQLEGDPTPIASLAGVVVGSWGPVIVSVTAVLALLAMANAGLLAASRFPFAMSRHHLLPGLFQHVSARFMTPVPAIVLTGVAMAAMLLSLDVIRIAKLASAFMIASFVVVNIAVVILRESGAQWYTPSFRSPAYPFVQLAGVATGLVILVMLGGVALAGLGIGAALGVVLFGLHGRGRVSRMGVLRQMARRRDLLERAPSELRQSEPSAQTVVTLVGGESSAEALVHLGMTMAADQRLSVLCIRDVPEQTDLAAIVDEPDDRFDSLERRILGLGVERGVDVNVDLVLTRDVRETVFDYADREHPQWMVMAWRDRTMRGILLRHPLQWLTSHLPCNLALFKDAGIRTYRKLMALAEPGPHDALVARTADDLARLFRADVTFVRFVADSASDETVEEIRSYHEALGRLCHGPTASEIVRGTDELESLVHATARFDLLVIGAPPARAGGRAFLRAPEDRLTEHAHCAVLCLRASPTTPHRSVAAAPQSETTRSTTNLQLLLPAAVEVRAPISDKQQLFERLGSMFADVFEHADPAAVERELWERERQQSTAMGQGVAIPHATVSAASRTRLTLLTLEQAIDYGDAGETVDTVLCLVGPSGDREAHLRLLSRLARLIVEGGLLADLRAAQTEDEAIEAVGRAAARVTEDARP